MLEFIGCQSITICQITFQETDGHGFFNLVAIGNLHYRSQIGEAYSNSIPYRTDFRLYGAVPIPPALWLFGSGLLGLVGVARHSKRKKQ
jgi:hypothetical protein